MEEWYGVDILTMSLEKGYVIDHINNESNDSRMQNLAFLLKRYNTAKGHTIDIDSKKFVPFQMSLIFNVDWRIVFSMMQNE